MQGDWRRALRLATGITAIVVLIALSISAQTSTSDSTSAIVMGANAGVYIERLFYAVIVVGVAAAIYIATRSGEP